MNADFFLRSADSMLNGVMLLAALWVAYSCFKRMNLMHWKFHDTLTMAAYIAICLWAISRLLGLHEFEPLGILGVAALFVAGRKRWLSQAPEDTRTAP